MAVIVAFSFVVDIVGGKAKCDFSAETDLSWPGFQRCVSVYLRNVVELTYKVTGDTGGARFLNNANKFKTAMERICQKVYSAHTHAVVLEIRDIVRAHQMLYAKLTFVHVRPNILLLRRAS
jgi:hypothetical protein